jgi:hypothetical protein
MNLCICVCVCMGVSMCFAYITTITALIIIIENVNQSLANLRRTAIRLHFQNNCVSNKLNDMATNTKPNNKYAQQANNCTSGPWNVFFGTRSPNPMVDNVTKQKYAPSTILQFSHIEKITVPMLTYVISMTRINVIGTWDVLGCWLLFVLLLSSSSSISLSNSLLMDDDNVVCCCCCCSF